MDDVSIHPDVIAEREALEKQIKTALRSGTIPEDILPWALDIMRFGWTEPGTRLDRLRTIADAIERRPRVIDHG